MCRCGEDGHKRWKGPESFSHHELIGEMVRPAATEVRITLQTILSKLASLRDISDKDEKWKPVSNQWAAGHYPTYSWAPWRFLHKSKKHAVKVHESVFRVWISSELQWSLYFVSYVTKSRNSKSKVWYIANFITGMNFIAVIQTKPPSTRPSWGIGMWSENTFFIWNQYKSKECFMKLSNLVKLR